MLTFSAVVAADTMVRWSVIFAFCATTFGYTKHDRILDMLYEQISELSLEVAHTTKNVFKELRSARGLS